MFKSACQSVHLHVRACVCVRAPARARVLQSECIASISTDRYSMYGLQNDLLLRSSEARRCSGATLPRLPQTYPYQKKCTSRPSLARASPFTVLLPKWHGLAARMLQMPERLPIKSETVPVYLHKVS